jgi:hypothetical protein
MHHPPTAIIAIVVALLTAGTAASQNVNQAAQTVKDVMQTMTIPASDAICSAASEPPKDEPQWVALRASAVARALVTEAEATLKAIDTLGT